MNSLYRDQPSRFCSALPSTSTRTLLFSSKVLNNTIDERDTGARNSKRSITKLNKQSENTSPSHCAGECTTGHKNSANNTLSDRSTDGELLSTRDSVTNSSVSETDTTSCRQSAASAALPCRILNHRRSYTNTLYRSVSSLLPSQRTMIILVFCVIAPLHLIGHTHGQNGSGDGEGGEELVSCYECIQDSAERADSNGQPICNEVARLTECFQSCGPSIAGDDPFGINHLEMVQNLRSLSSRLQEANCEVTDLNAPGGCNIDSLACLDNLYSASNFQCSDDAMVNLLGCTANTPDCEWRNHIETIASKARRSVCDSPERCITGGLLFVVGPNCKSFRFAPVSNLSSMPISLQPVAPGTIFDTRICRLNHARLGTCRL